MPLHARHDAAAAVASMVAAATLVMGAPCAAWAGDGSLTEPQHLVAEAWRQVDKRFVDRTFNGHEDWFKLRQEFVHRKYADNAAAYGGVSELLALLGDPYTKFLPPAKFATVVNAATASVGGVGVELLEDVDGAVRCGDLQPGSPAERAGLKRGDTLASVDGVPVGVDATQGSADGARQGAATADDVASLLRGPPGDPVGIVVRRGSEVLDFRPRRELLKIQTVSSRVWAGNSPGNPRVGVVRIKFFSSATAEDVRAQVGRLLSGGGGVSAVVLDLRGNPGGLLQGGADTARLFLPKGAAVVRVQDAKGAADQQTVDRDLAERAREDGGPGADGQFATVPLIVVVNGKTASAAEVLASSLQDHGRAAIIGSQSFGKGVVQNVAALQDGACGVSVTVATYTTPSGRSLNKVGVSPNRLLACAPLDNLEDCLAADPAALKTPPPPPTALAAP